MGRVSVHILLATCVWLAVLVMLSPPHGSRGSYDESSAIGSLRTIASDELEYHNRAGRFGTMRELALGGLLDEGFLCSSVRNGYRFDLEVAPDGQGFTAQADPVPATGWLGWRIPKSHFFVDATGRIRSSQSREAGPSDRVLGE